MKAYTIGEGRKLEQIDCIFIELTNQSTIGFFLKSVWPPVEELSTFDAKHYSEECKYRGGRKFRQISWR